MFKLNQNIQNLGVDKPRKNGNILVHRTLVESFGSFFCSWTDFTNTFNINIQLRFSGLKDVLNY